MTARSAQSRLGLGLVQRSTATSCRKTSSSAFLDADERPSRTSQPQSRTKIRSSRRRDTTDHHAYHHTSPQVTEPGYILAPDKPQPQLSRPRSAPAMPFAVRHPSGRRDRPPCPRRIAERLGERPAPCPLLALAAQLEQRAQAHPTWPRDPGGARLTATAAAPATAVLAVLRRSASGRARRGCSPPPDAARLRCPPGSGLLGCVGRHR
jgi:hypothetical protein